MHAPPWPICIRPAARCPAAAGQWCNLAAELSARSGDPEDAAARFLEVGRRAVTGGALSTAAEGAYPDRRSRERNGPLGVAQQQLARAGQLLGDTDLAARAGRGCAGGARAAGCAA